MISFVVSPGTAGPPSTGLSTLIRTSTLPTQLSDHLRFALDEALDGDPPEGFIAIGAVAASAGDPTLVGYGQVSRAHDADLMEIAMPTTLDQARLDPARHDQGRIGIDLLNTIVDAHSSFDGSGPLRWWTDLAEGAVVDAAQARGFVLERRLHNMTIDLGEFFGSEAANQTGIQTRAFDPSTDGAGVLGVNNRAFAEHGEQGGWTVADLRQRLDQKWFRPEGLRILTDDGNIVGFCWTKPHGDDLGEIYIVAVDPDAEGKGLGTRLVVDGLRAIERTGARRAMLWVDAENPRAVSLYERLGFTIGRSRSAFLRDGDR